MVKEVKIEDHLVRRAKGAGGEVRKLIWKGRRGAPDRFVVVPEELWLVELKRPGEKPEAHQAREHKRLRDLGVTVLVFDTIAQIDEHFDAYLRRRGGVHPAVAAYQRTEKLKLQ